jgi:hypothetical protein
VYSVSVLLLLLHCFVFTLVLLLCCVYRSSLYCIIPLDLCTLCLSRYYFYIVLYLFLSCCNVVYPDHICSDLCSLCLSRYYFHIVLSLFLSCCYVVYPDHICSDLCSLCLSCYYFYIVLSLHLYCCYVVYTDHHFTVIYLQTCVLCVCFVITSKLFYLYTCTVVMLCIQIITLL